MNGQQKYFMVEGGRAQELVKAHLAEVLRVRTEVRALAAELGFRSEDYSSTKMMPYTSSFSGVLTGIDFGTAHPPKDFTKPDKRGVCRPKRGTPWAKKFAEQKGFPEVSPIIAQELCLPTAVGYRSDDGKGWTVLGGFSPYGFLWLSKDGPYLMWAPDIAAAVAEKEEEGYTVDDDIKNFKFDVPGLRPVELEEWDILVLQDKLAKKVAA